MGISTSGFVIPEDFMVSDIFTEISVLYSGVYCIIYKAKRYGQWYVLKCLKEEYCQQMLYRELLKKEFNISISLLHSNIVRTIGWEKVPNLGECIIMEYVDGMSLEDYLKEKHTSKEKVRVIKGIISALDYLHGKQIVHRDLKPANIMVTTNGSNAKLLDFGLSDTDSYCILKQPAGTENYISPEQLTQSVPDCRNDIYSLGCIIRKADINLFYNYLAYRCMLTRSARFANVESILSCINRWERVLYALPLMILFVVSAVSISLYTASREAGNDREKFLNAAIEAGKLEVNRIYQPMIEFIGGRKKISNEEYEELSNIISEIGTSLETMCDSMTNGMDEVSKSAFLNTIYIYSSDLFEKIGLPESEMEE